MKQQIHKKPWNKLTPRQKSTRKKALAVITQSKKSKRPVSIIARENEISLSTVQKHTNAFKKVKGRWIPKKWDKVSRSVTIVENGKFRSVQVSDSRHSTTIGRYHNAVRHYLNTGDSSKLKKFKKKKIRDSNGKLHSFETRLKIIEEIHESIEEIEFFEVYD
ncbi:hypothetical protein [Nitrosopumilus sp. b3]|uniref:hypothetical protein n=1 Tax=Nitrosopumilus sp. b3 TaxID=2109909 RepID=UPI0015F62BBA|nr:hypothetical protein [Nitrosopumilus sp. b3]